MMRLEIDTGWRSARPDRYRIAMRRFMVSPGVGAELARAHASWRRSRRFSSASSRLRRLAISRRCRGESSLAHCRAGNGVLGSGRCWAARIRWMLLSARMFGLPWFWIVEGGDDAVQVVQDLTVHLGQTLLTAGFGGGDELQGSVAADVGEVRRNLAGSQTLCGQGQYDFIDACQPTLPLLDDLRL
jgi:hypothetical protein